MGEPRASARYLSEFVGTFVLVATVCGNVLGKEPVWAGVSIGCALGVMVYCLGRVSGGHFNPAVSLACGLAGKCPMKDVVFYTISQVWGGLLAGLFTMAMYKGQGTGLAPVGDYSWWQAGLAELIYTAMLCLVVLNTATSKAHAGKHQFYGISIGFTIIAGAYGAGNVSGGCFNPAVALSLDFASAIVTASSPSFYSILYVGFEILAAIAAAGLYRMLRPEDYTEDEIQVPLYSKLLAEFLGTYMLVLTVSLNVMTESKAGAFSIACSLMCMIFAFGSVSGAHLNPAVTVAVVASGRGKCSMQQGLEYIIVQLLAGYAASQTGGAIAGGSFEALKPASSEWYQVIMAEALFTCVLAFTVLSVATVHDSLTHYFGFAIGMCVTIGGFAIGGLSGGSLNPAVSLGIATKANIDLIWQFVPYAVTEAFAGLLAAAVFRMTQPSEFVARKSIEAEKGYATGEEPQQNETNEGAVTV